MRTKQDTLKYVMCALCIAVNIVLGIVVGSMKLPFYGDTIGTILSAALFGPAFGALVGFMSSFIKSVLFNGLQNLPFALVNVMIGLVVGWVFKKRNFTMPRAVGVGLVLSFLCALVGTPIGVAVYGGLTGTVSDVLVGFLKQSGADIFAASFVAKIGNNLIDKVGSCVLVCVILKHMPSRLKLKKAERIA